MIFGLCHKSCHDEVEVVGFQRSCLSVVGVALLCGKPGAPLPRWHGCFPTTRGLAACCLLCDVYSKTRTLFTLPSV